MLHEHAYNPGGSLKRPKTVTDESLQAKLVERWEKYLEGRKQDPRLTIDGWLQLVNDPPVIKQRNNDLGIRDFRFATRAEAQAVIRTVRQIVANVVAQVSAGFDSFDHHPLSLFQQVMEITDRTRLRQCVMCPRYFRAKPANKRVCSERCGTLLRVRRHRAKQPKYELNRKLKGAAG